MSAPISKSTDDRDRIEAIRAKFQAEKPSHARVGIAMPKRHKSDLQQLAKDAAWEAMRTQPRRVDEDVSIPGVGIRIVHLQMIAAFQSWPPMPDKRSKDSAKG